MYIVDGINSIICQMYNEGHTVGKITYIFKFLNESLNVLFDCTYIFFLNFTTTSTTTTTTTTTCMAKRDWKLLEMAGNG